MPCDVNKIESNATGLNFAEEECAKVLPASPVWYGLEPNGYKDFGADNKTVARKPINALRKNQKGTVVDRDVSGGFDQDFTQTNLARLMQTFFFAAIREKPDTKPYNGSAVVLTTVATSDDGINAASGLSIFKPNHLVTLNGSLLNDGLKTVATVATGKVTVSQNLVDEALPAGATLKAVGYQFASGALAQTVSAALATLTITGLAAATGTLTFSAQPTAADTVTINGVVYTFVAALSTGPTVAYQVLRGANQAASQANLAAAINGGSGVGTTYSTGTVAHPNVTAAVVGATVVVTAIYAGTSGNAITTTESGTGTSWGAATLASGAGGVGFRELGLIPGEWVFVGGDATNTMFGDSNTQGYGRVHTVSDSVLTMNQTTNTPLASTGTGRTIQLFFGDMLRDEDVVALITKRYVQLERTLGSDSAGPQAEYLLGCIGNEFTLSSPTGDKLVTELSFVASGYETRTGLQGLKDGTRVAAPGESAFNTSSDVYRLAVTLVDPTVLNAADIVGFVEQFNIKISNGVTADKAIGVVGGFDTTASNFAGSGDATAYFTELSGPIAVSENADASMNSICARANAGFVFDMPLLGLGGGRLDVAADKAVKMPLTMNGGQSVYGHTLAYVNFSYLPDAAMPV